MSVVFADDWLTVHHGDWLDVLREMPDESVNCVVTSPPYWGLRDYGVAGQLGLETTPEEYVARLVGGFREVRRVLRSDGTCWLNLGDSYASHDPGDRRDGQFLNPDGVQNDKGRRSGPAVRNRAGIYRSGGLKPKDRVMIPARVALALQADGWWLRDEIVWAKPNPMPSSVGDRTTPSHEMVYLLTKSARYWYDAAAIREATTGPDNERNRFGARLDVGYPGHSPDRRRNGARRTDKQAAAPLPGSASSRTQPGFNDRWDAAEADRASRVKVPGGWDITKGTGGHGSIHREGRTEATYAEGGADGQRRMRDRTLAARADGAPHDDPFGNGRNKRSVWTVATAPYPEAHFATFPPKLIEPMILAGCPGGGVVLDPFAGSGTTGMVAQSLSRRAVLIDLNADYLLQALDRNRAIPLGIEVPA